MGDPESDYPFRVCDSNQQTVTIEIDLGMGSFRQLDLDINVFAASSNYFLPWGDALGQDIKNAIAIGKATILQAQSMLYHHLKIVNFCPPLQNQPQSPHPPTSPPIPQL
jgi:hypothetical protein